jgi:hypothetical protein
MTAFFRVALVVMVYWSTNGYLLQVMAARCNGACK